MTKIALVVKSFGKTETLQRFLEPNCIIVASTGHKAFLYGEIERPAHFPHVTAKEASDLLKRLFAMKRGRR